MIRDPGFRALTAVAVGGLFAALASAAEPRPLPIEDALREAEITQRVPLEFSPDGQWVAYTVQDPIRIEPPGDVRYEVIPRTGAGPEALGSDIWIVNVAGGQAQNLTEGRGTSWGPTWSPDGRSLAFFSDRDGFARVWIWDVATRGMRRVSDAILRSYFNFEVARWSPDGSRILAKLLPEGLTLEGVRDMTTGPLPASKKDPKGRADREGAPSGAAPEEPERSEAASSADKPDWVNVNRADLAAIEVATGAVRRLTTNLRPRGYWFSPDGSRVAFTDLTGWTRNTQQPNYDLVCRDARRRPDQSPRAKPQHGLRHLGQLVPRREVAGVRPVRSADP